MAGMTFVPVRERGGRGGVVVRATGNGGVTEGEAALCN